MVTGAASRPLFLVAAGLLLAVAVGLSLVFFLRRPFAAHQPPRDPRADYTGPFRNVSPSVGYVAEGRCADCHADLARSFAEHPMGRSLWAAGREAGPPEDEAHHNPFDALGSRFHVAHDGGRLQHRRTQLDAAGRPIPEVEAAWDVGYVLGSGARGHSYLIDRDGYLFMSPISWYSQKEVWDLAPGIGQALRSGRPVLPDCVFCHANRATHVDGSVNHYARPLFEGHAIGCQRCHGPGELHVASPGARKPDPTIVNPRHLEPALRNAVCEQCHLVGVARVPRRGRGVFDFRPGLPLEAFWATFVRPPEAEGTPKAVDHVEQMYQSRCFRDGEGLGQLGCISCHDPHQRVAPAQRVAHYRKRCLNCHGDHGCSLAPAERLRRSAEDSCIDCHMPRYGASNIAHTAPTDHRIPRDGKAAARGKTGPAAGDGAPLVSFYRGRAADDADGERDLGVALIKSVLAGEAADNRAIGRVIPGLATAVARDPDDFAAGEARGYALALGNRPAEALAAFEAVLARAPERELALVGAASMAEAAGQPDAARDYWRRAVTANPWMPDYRRSLAVLLLKKQAWDEARPQCDAWVRLDPLSAEARAARVACLLAAGDKDEARAEFARVEAMAPENLAELQARFAKKLK